MNGETRAINRALKDDASSKTFVSNCRINILVTWPRLLFRSFTKDVSLLVAVSREVDSLVLTLEAYS